MASISRDALSEQENLFGKDPMRDLRAAFASSLSVCVALMCLVGTSLANDPFGDFRGLWISRFDYNEDSTFDIQSKINNAADMGITDVIWQVRAKSDAYYNSNFETPAEDWQQQIDPLQIAIDTAQARGVKLHAWLNTMPLWRDTAAPNDPNHIYYNTDPSFRVADINGNVESYPGGSSSFSGSYGRINHVLPEAQQHINNVVNDIATNYDVDGIHLDYIRWLGPGGGSSEGFRPDWDFLPHDPYSHQLYFNETGLDASDGSTFAKRDAYRDWVRDRVTDLVTSVGQTVDAAEISEGREIELSAAVWNNPTTAENDYLQDYRTWMEQDLLDIAIPMVYLSESNRNLMQPFLNDIFATPTNTEVSIGLGSYLHDGSATRGGVEQTISQMQQVYDDGRADSLTFFAYGSLFGGSLDNARRQAVIDWYDGLDDPGTVDLPPGGSLAAGSNLLTSFDVEGDEGFFASSITAGGQTTIDNSSSADQTSTMSHVGDGSQLLDINADGAWTLRHLSGGASPGGNEALVAEGSIGFWLKTDTPGITVQIGLDDPSSADLGTLKNVVADGEWRLYQWDLEDDSQWSGWVTGDGIITGPTLTIDSIFFYGSGNAEVFLDTVAHNPNGSLLSGDYDGNGLIDEADYVIWRDSYGQSGGGLAADGNRDNRVDAADFSVWRDAFDAMAPAQAVPEPVSIALFALACLPALVARTR
ncbi:MAG: family 10 glycosylhydrolase [Planctomycetota bacterium]